MKMNRELVIVASAAGIGTLGGFLASSLYHKRIYRVIVDKALFALSTSGDIVDECGTLMNNLFGDGLSSEEVNAAGERIEDKIKFFNIVINEDV